MNVGDAFSRHLSLFGELEPADRGAIHALPAKVRKLRRSEDALSIGQRPRHAVIVLEGLMQRYTMTAQGGRQIHEVYIPTDAPCLETLHIGVMDNSLSALSTCKIGLIEHADLFRAMEARPNLLALVWRETLIQASMFREWLVRNSQMLAHARLAHFFCEMLTRARAAGVAHGLATRLPLNQEDLADCLGMTNVHVNRTLMMLRSSGLVEFKSGALEVFDWDGLVELAEFDPAYLHLRPQEHPASHPRVGAPEGGRASALRSSASASR